jgi:hypothetical protein
MIRRECGLLMAFVLVALVAPLPAQEDASDVPALEFRRIPDVPGGRLAAIAGDVDAEGLRFSVPDLSVLQPVDIQLLATDPARPARLEITKFGFDGVLRESVTGADGLTGESFRTQMGVTVRVSALEAPASFQLLAFVGDELEAVPRNVLTPLDTRGGGSSAMTWALLAGGMIVLAGLVVLRTRRSK